MALEKREEGAEFEDRSDYLRDEDLVTWNVQSDFFNNIQKELIGTGNRLLEGPRGTGKTQQMRIARLTCRNNPSKPFAVFVSLNKYFHLEPLLTKNVNAIQVFHAWVLTKVIIGAVSFAQEVNKDQPIALTEFSQDGIETTLEQLRAFEKNVESPYEIERRNYDLSGRINLTNVLSFVERLTLESNRKRAVILLDDAALTLTPEYFVEFLDIFRSLKTRTIAPKASVYPGTPAGARFQVGHDAQIVNCWMSIGHERYSEFMKSLLDIRLASHVRDIGADMLEVMIFAAFGVPRTLIGLIRAYQEANSKDRTAQAKYNSSIEQRVHLIESEYSTLKTKMPQYADIIGTGWTFFKTIVSLLGEENRKLSDFRLVEVGIEEEHNKMYDRMLGFLNEAGLLHEIDSNVKHGPNREYRRFIPHLLFLLKDRAFSIGRGFNLSETLKKLKAKDKKHPLRRKMDTVLSKVEVLRLKLNLPPCQVCATLRLTEDQKFCHHCGNQLINKSAFDRCMEMSIEDLPLTEWQKGKLNTIQITTVGEFMSLSNPSGELRKVRGIGKVRSQSIATRIQLEAKGILEKALEDFLS